MNKIKLYYYHSQRRVVGESGNIYDSRLAVRLFNTGKAIAGNNSFKRLVANNGNMDDVEREYLAEEKKIIGSEKGKKTVY